VSKCDDVKKVFSLSKCDFPETRVELPSKKVVIEFSTADDDWVVPHDTVVNVLVIFRELPKLLDYTRDFSGYTIKHERDAPELLIYRNDKDGIELTVQTAMARGLYIGSIFLYPSQENVLRLKQGASRKSQ
jgi:hypothetical protein